MALPQQIFKKTNKFAALVYAEPLHQVLHKVDSNCGNYKQDQAYVPEHTVAFTSPKFC
jgi:hypothetical protein